MAVIEINTNPSKKDLRQFTLIWFPAFFAIVGGLVYHFSRSLQAAYIIWGAALAISIVGLAAPSFMRLIFVGLMYLSFPIGWTISHILLAIIFYGVMTPIGILLRLFGHDPMTRKIDRSADSYWLSHTQEQQKGRYFRQF